MRIAALLGLGLAASLLWSQAAPDGASVSAPPIAKPKVQLMTSLPLVWGEGGSMQDILSGISAPAPIYRHWAQVFNMEPVDSFEALKNSEVDLVILAQPRAMAPADLADFDKWVRGGGKAIILTDPALLWHSELPFGDARRPLAVGLLSPLLKHWGLKLLPPDDTRGEIAELGFDGFSVIAASPGSFAYEGENKNAHCILSQGGILAECKVGKGKAILFADADFLHNDLLGAGGDDAGSERVSNSGAARLIDALTAELLTKS